MAPYRSPQAPEIDPQPHHVPSALLALGLRERAYRLTLRTGDRIREVEIAHAGAAVRARRSVEIESGARGIAGYATGSGAIFFEQGRNVCSVADGAAGFERRASVGGVVLGLPLALDPTPCMMTAAREPGAIARGPQLRVLDPDLVTERTPGWFAPPSARTLCGATSTVLGPVAVLATDREDEIDVCAYRGPGGGEHRTISLGRGQRFECASGGGHRLAVVSRGAQGLVVRTLARDLRSELNPAPVPATAGWSVGAVRCGWAGESFLVVHAEHCEDASAVVVTVFDGTARVALRAPLTTVDAVAFDGTDAIIAAVVPGASGPLFVVYKIALGTGDRARAAVRSFGPRWYAYFLDAPAHATPGERRAALADVARVVAVSLGAVSARDFRARALDERSDLATFWVPGSDRAHDVTVDLLARRDGSAVAAVRIGHGGASHAAAAHFVEPAGNAVAARLNLASLSAAAEAIVSAIFGLRCVA